MPSNSEAKAKTLFHPPLARSAFRGPLAALHKLRETASRSHECSGHKKQARDVPREEREGER